MGMSNTLREELHTFIDRLGDDELELAKERLLEPDPALQAVLAISEQEIEDGKVRPAREVLAELRARFG